MRTQLNYVNLDILEGQLARGEHLDDLYRVDGSKYPHWDVLQSYMLSGDPALRKRWSACLFKLIELKAPVDLPSQRQCVAAGLVDKRWDPLVELTRELARKYLEAGYIDLARPLPGRLPAGSLGLFCTGKLPLAAAIGYDNPEAVRFFCESGASWDIGPVVEGGGDREALEYAQAHGLGASVAVLVELTMRAQLDAAPVASAVGTTVGVRARRACL